jgi:dihydropyrimidinase
MKTLIKNGTIVTSAETYRADILIEDEKISSIGKSLSDKADKTIDASGKLIFPGGIDPHVHLDMPSSGTISSDNFETGTRAALFGGTTTVIDFVNQKKGGTLNEALAERKNRSVGKAFADFGFHMVITDFNEKTRAEIKNIIEKEGITSFKTFMAYKDTLMIDDFQMIAVMNEIKKYGATVTVHATNGAMIDSLISLYKSEEKLSPLYHFLSQPEITESEAVARFADMSFFTGVNSYIVHLTCESALNHIREAAKRNQKIYVETCTQYLLLDSELYTNSFESAKYVMSPPLRPKKNQAALWAGINQGLIQTVGTDHCPFMLKDKRLGENDFSKIPNGFPGIENRMELLFSEGVLKNRISLNKFVEITSTNAARIFGINDSKGSIAVGYDADLVIFDPNEKHSVSAETHHTNCDYSGYEGWELTGKCKTVLLRGKIAVDNNTFLLETGNGKYIKRKTF